MSTFGATLLEEKGTVLAQCKRLFSIILTTFPSAEVNYLDRYSFGVGKKAGYSSY